MAGECYCSNCKIIVYALFCPHCNSKLWPGILPVYKEGKRK